MQPRRLRAGSPSHVHGIRGGGRAEAAHGPARVRAHREKKRLGNGTVAVGSAARASRGAGSPRGAPQRELMTGRCPENGRPTAAWLGSGEVLAFGYLLARACLREAGGWRRSRRWRIKSRAGGCRRALCTSSGRSQQTAWGTTGIKLAEALAVKNHSARWPTPQYGIVGACGQAGWRGAAPRKARAAASRPCRGRSHSMLAAAPAHIAAPRPSWPLVPLLLATAGHEVAAAAAP
ncbi:MAG: hypothetical protein J3K34DRAFT_445121 [Monoraphidium minutum]|nr:MAG: hypothetical protein J3K34DRAFT_445121 [Monoraphidium minutum]